jgi:hypothetical protein
VQGGVVVAQQQGIIINHPSGQDMFVSIPSLQYLNNTSINLRPYGMKIGVEVVFAILDFTIRN